MTNNEQFTQMWRKSRENSGKSQDYVAKAMGISKKTVQNWESGYSCPDLAQGLEWFKVLGLQPLPYFMDVLYPNLVDLHTEDDLNNALCSLIKDFSSDYKKKLLYLLAGNHGSSPAGVVEMMVAHLHLPISQRLNTAHNIITNYEVDEKYGALVEPDEIHPNINLLIQCYENCLDAVKDGKKQYDLINEKGSPL